MSFKPTDIAFVTTLVALSLFLVDAKAQTPGYPEKVVQWTVKSGESCEDIAKAMYGSATHKGLIQRYNSVACTPGAPLRDGMTLVLPAKVTTLPTAKITSVNPETRARPSGGGWGTAYAGQSLGKASSVNTRSKGRAGIQFRDRTRVYLAEHTLVVIYGTAGQSQVSKSPPPAVQLDSGEVQAVLAALRGRPVGIDVAGGGRVDAASKDAVIAKKGKQTNVSVFQGRAAVSSAGKKVDVPTNYGTRFWVNTAPEKPRPLPAAPAWEPGGAAPVELAFADRGIVTASWGAVPKAKRYRVEVSRDAAFVDLVLRAHVPADVRSFRAEALPPGRYHLRVRVIDTDDFLGIASAPRIVDLIGAEWKRGSGRITAAGLAVGRYSILSLQTPAALELAFDERPAGAVPSSLDFRRLDPSSLRFHRDGVEVHRLAVHYVDPVARLHVKRTGKLVAVELTFEQVEGLDVAKTLQPTASVRVGGRDFPVALSPSGPASFVGTALVSERKTIDVFARDDFGRTLASVSRAPRAMAPDAVPVITPPRRRIAAMSPVLGLSPRTSVLWTSPTAENHGALGVRIDSGRSPPALQGFAHGAGAIGPIGLDATVMTPATEDAPADSSALLGLRFRAFRNQEGSFEFGPTVRVAFPLDDVGPSPRLEPSLAFGGVLGNLSWLVNTGARVRLDGPTSDRTFVDAVQAFTLAGGTYDPLAWMRLFALVDVHLLVPEASASALGRGGLSLGVEAGERFFVSLGGRVSPWDDVGAGHLAGQLAIGFREN